MTDVLPSMELTAAAGRRSARSQAGPGSSKARMAQTDASAGILVNCENDIWYLTGFVGHSALPSGYGQLER